jgi:hypothetical protein
MVGGIKPTMYKISKKNENNCETDLLFLMSNQQSNTIMQL